MRSRMLIWMLMGLAVLGIQSEAQVSELTFTLLTDNSVLNHYPAADNIIGTTDDIVSDQPAGSGPSAPNNTASLSYFTVTFPGGFTPQQPEFEGHVIRFLTGGFSLQATAAKGRAYDIVITSGTLDGTVANPFVGRSVTSLGEQGGAPDGLSATFSNDTLEGIFDHTTRTPDIQSGDGVFPFIDQILMGAKVTVVPRAEFGATGDDYMDNVVAPLIQSQEVTGILRFEFEFTEVQEPDTGLNGAVVAGVFVATTTDIIPPLSIGEETPTFTFTVTETPTETPSETPSLTFSLTPTEELTPTLTETLLATLTRSADINEDGEVDAKDLIILLERMKEAIEPTPTSTP